MYEPGSRPLLPPTRFYRRLALHVLGAVLLVLASLGLGMLGYHEWGGQSWIDSFLNAAMLLGGMGPVGQLTTNSGKLFAGFFALYSGLVLLAVTTLILAPVLHRLLHRVHLEEDDGDAGSRG